MDEYNMRETLKKMLLDANISQANLAKNVGVRPATINDFIRGRTSLGCDTYEACLIYLNKGKDL